MEQSIIGHVTHFFDKCMMFGSTSLQSGQSGRRGGPFPRGVSMVIATVCNMGYGSSLILKLKIEEFLKSNNLDAEVKAVEINNIKKVKPDILFASVELKDKIQGFDGHCVWISNFLEAKEIEKQGKAAIEEFLKNN